MADRRVIDSRDVYHGPEGALALIGAFLAARGEFEISVTTGVAERTPDELLVLVEIGDVKAVFAPVELRWMGERIIERLPMAKRFGAPDRDVEDLARFADLLIRNAADATAISPHGLH